MSATGARASGGGSGATIIAIVHPDADGYAPALHALARGLGYKHVAVGSRAAAVTAAADVARADPRALVAVVDARDTLVLRAPPALAAAVAAASGGGGGNDAVVVCGGMPSLGAAADWAAALAVSPTPWEVAPSVAPPQGKRNPRGLRHLDGGGFVGAAAAVANLLRHLERQVKADAAADWTAAAAALDTKTVARVVIDAREHSVMVTLDAAADLVPQVDSEDGSTAIVAAASGARPVLVRAPYGGNLAAVLRMLELDTPSVPPPLDTPLAAARAAAVAAAWRAHSAAAVVAAVLLAAVVVAVVAGVAAAARRASSAVVPLSVPLPPPMYLPPMYYAVPQ